MKYKPPEHVIQFSPDFSMLLHSKPKRRRKREGDDSFVWLGDVGTTSFRKRPKHKKKNKKVGLIIHYNGCVIISQLWESHLHSCHSCLMELAAFID